MTAHVIMSVDVVYPPAGTAAMLAHVVHNDPKAKAAVTGIKVSAVGVATPAVLTEPLAGQCSDYITSVVLMVSHGLVMKVLLPVASPGFFGRQRIDIKPR
jgi:hypothetical protein